MTVTLNPKFCETSRAPRAQQAAAATRIVIPKKQERNSQSTTFSQHEKSDFNIQKLKHKFNTRTQRTFQRKPHHTRMLNLKQKPNKGTLCCLYSLTATHSDEDRYLGFMASWKSFFTAVILAFCANTSLVTRSKASSGHHLMHCGSPLSLHKSQT